MTGELPAPRVFVSYAWEGGESSPYHEWVGAFCTRLIGAGVNVRLDRWHRGDRTILQFMNAEAREADKLLILCSPGYREKVHNAETSAIFSGSGWEAMLITSAMFYASGARKIVPVLTMGAWTSSAPDFLLGYPHFDLTDSDAYETHYLKLLHRLLDLEEAAPAVAERPLELRTPSPAPAPARRGYRHPGAAVEQKVARIAAELAEARHRRARLLAAGQEETTIEAEILTLKRQLREGGRLQVGDCLSDRYLLTEWLGEGGYATVWRAKDELTRSEVAVKVLHPNLAGNLTSLERFRRGARIMAELDHPNIVRLLETGCEDFGWHYFVMECLPGGDLSQATFESRMSRDEAFDTIHRVADALIYTHSQGHVHRDVKPANILLTADQTPKLSDFDLVLTDDTTGGTRSGAMGTFIYAPPESLSRPQGVDERADVYSLAMTLLFCLYGRPLPLSVVRSPMELLQEVALRPVFETALSWNVENRYPNVAAFKSALTEHERLEDNWQPSNISSPGEATTYRPASSTGPAVAKDVPPSYFKDVQEGTWLRSRTKRWGTLGAAVATITVIGLSALKGRQTVATDRIDGARATVASLPAPAPAPPPPSAAPEPSARPPTTKEVLVAASPPDTHMFRGEEDLGVGPISIQVAKGEPTQLTLKRPGYKPQVLNLDGSRPRIHVALEYIPAPAVVRPPPKESPSTTSKKKPGMGGGGIVNPWD